VGIVSRDVDRDTVIWTLVVFFGATVLFGAIRNATQDDGVGLSLGLQAVAALLVIGGLVLWVRRSRR
jgi:membrane protein DedA with SNARE-associated domain